MIARRLANRAAALADHVIAVSLRGTEHSSKVPCGLAMAVCIDQQPPSPVDRLATTRPR